jgi:hypothetical protein
VKLLLDQNLSRNLVGRLLSPHPDTTRVALIGNASTAVVLQILLDRRPAIEAFDADIDDALLVLPDLPTQ